MLLVITFNRTCARITDEPEGEWFCEYCTKRVQLEPPRQSQLDPPKSCVAQLKPPKHIQHQPEPPNKHVILEPPKLVQLKTRNQEPSPKHIELESQMVKKQVIKFIL